MHLGHRALSTTVNIYTAHLTCVTKRSTCNMSQNITRLATYPISARIEGIASRRRSVSTVTRRRRRRVSAGDAARAGDAAQRGSGTDGVRRVRMEEGLEVGEWGEHGVARGITKVEGGVVLATLMKQKLQGEQ